MPIAAPVISSGEERENAGEAREADPDYRFAELDRIFESKDEDDAYRCIGVERDATSEEIATALARVLFLETLLPNGYNEYSTAMIKNNIAFARLKLYDQESRDAYDWDLNDAEDEAARALETFEPFQKEIAEKVGLVRDDDTGRLVPDLDAIPNLAGSLLFLWSIEGGLGKSWTVRQAHAYP